jgi:hypothetical protein
LDVVPAGGSKLFELFAGPQLLQFQRRFGAESVDLLAEGSSDSGYQTIAAFHGFAAADPAFAADRAICSGNYLPATI